jgi:antitoxin component YwqK of YwqJK toxin-antitoxin module
MNKGKYADDNKTGIWLTYYKTGELMTEINFRLGQRDGLAKAYNKAGKIIESTTYKNGEKIK